MLREDHDGGLIQQKLKVLFANFPKQERLDFGLILRKHEGFVVTLPKRGGQTIS